MRQEKRGTSPWVWVAGGCGGCLVLSVIVVVGLSWWGYSSVKGFVEGMENPETRDAKVREILGAESLPEGYHAAMGLTIPWMAEVAILSDREVHWHRKDKDSLDIDLDDEDFGDRVFLYFNARTFGDADEDAEDFFHGKGSGSVRINNQSLRVRSDELLREGRIEIRGTPVRYRIDRGRVEDAGGGERIVTRIQFLCSDKGRLHLALWYGPAARSSTEAPPAEARPGDESGAAPSLPTDEASLSSFLGHFDVCR